MDQDGQVHEEWEEREQIISKYFDDLFLKEEATEVETDTVLRNAYISISEDDKAMLAAPFQLQELHEVAKALPENQKPGKDGVPTEFYTIMWETVGRTFLGAWNEVVSERKFDSKLFGISKKGGKVLKNELWNRRGISMRLSSSYKIAANALQWRLLNVLRNV
jgi:hypothetical protein